MQVSRLSNGPVRVFPPCPPSGVNGSGRSLVAPSEPGRTAGTFPTDDELGRRLSLYSDLCTDLFCRLQLERMSAQTRCFVSVSYGTFQRLYHEVEQDLVARGRHDLLEF